MLEGEAQASPQQVAEAAEELDSFSAQAEQALEELGALEAEAEELEDFPMAVEVDLEQRARLALQELAALLMAA